MNFTLMKYIASLALVLFISASSVAQKGDPNKFAVIINGPGGEPGYSKQFAEWTADLNSVLSKRYGFDPKQIKVLTEKLANAEEVKRTFASLKTELDAGNILYLFFIGHGSWDGKEAKFNLIGPDLSASDYNQLLSSLPTRRIVLFNMASASGEFVKPLSAKGRIVVTATRNGQETNATRFAGFFVTALSATDGDTDQDGHTSVL